MLMIYALLVNIKISTKLKNNKDFENIFDRFVDNMVSIHFGEDKSKHIVFATKFKIKKVRKANN